MKKRTVSLIGAMFLIGSLGIASSSLIVQESSSVGNYGGDLPFPLDRDENGVKLQEVWENIDSSRQVKIYKDDAGDTYVIIRDLRSGKTEVLRKIQ